MFAPTCLITILFCILCVANGSISVESATRRVDLTQSYASVTVDLKISSDGETSFDYLFPLEQADHVSFFGAKSASGSSLTVAKPHKSGNGVVYKISFAALKAGESRSFSVEYSLTHTIVPYPAEITNQAHQQLVKHADSAHIYSAYDVNTQTSIFKLASETVEFYTKVSETIKTKNEVKYGPYKQVVKALTITPILLHFQSEAKFITITGMTREYEVSHWGNLAVTDTYGEVIHTGVEFTGNFDRLRFTRQPSPSAISSFTQVLPGNVADIYYRDLIGNISTSHVHVNSESKTIFEIKPRFPLFGGWRASFKTGYNLLLSSVLSYNNEKGLYVLKVPFVEPLESSVIDDYTLKIILPEGAAHINVNVPFSVDEETRESHFTYLDTYGRPVVAIKKNHVVEAHRQNIKVTYSFSTIKMLQEPILLIVGVFCVLISIIFGSTLFSAELIKIKK